MRRAPDDRDAYVEYFARVFKSEQSAKQSAGQANAKRQ